MCSFLRSSLSITSPKTIKGTPHAQKLNHKPHEDIYYKNIQINVLRLIGRYETIQSVELLVSSCFPKFQTLPVISRLTCDP